MIDAVSATYTIDEDSTFVIYPGDLTVTDSDDTYPDDFSLIIKDSTNYTVLNDSLVIPNPELYQMLLSFGPDLEVKSPIEVKNEIAQKINKMKENYIYE